MTPKQIAFAEEYALCRNGQQAAVRAGYAPHAARIMASKLLTKANIIKIVRAREREYEARLEVSRDRLVAELVQAVELAKAQGDVLAVIAAWREVAKVCGYYPTALRCPAKVLEVNPS